ncbi:MAG TPA: non-ribosomal peptide synthetase [Candidatus Eisenbacteria bacterium]|nr:non-ribosomal peptide synthetase [Candidatus Eisenbacteria bacterium]
MRSDEEGSGVAQLKQEQLSLVHRVQRQAELRPEALAISAGREAITYLELENRSNQMANYLSSSGVAAGNVVGLCINRSPSFPVCALAILKTGAAYLPLEPKSPSRRLQTMLESARVRFVLTDSGTTPSVPSGDWKSIDLDASAAAISHCPNKFPPVPINAGQLAYVIFTSGSTGVPKPVAVGHDSLLNLVEWHNCAFNVTAADRASQLASIGFDAAVWELWPYFAAGASVHFVDDETRIDPTSLRDFLLKEKITFTFAPTPLAEHMLKLSWPEDAGLRFLLTGADTLHFYPSTNLPFTLVNNYGPTECTVVATSGIVPAKSGADKLPPIGRPIHNVDVYVLDRSMQKVSTGMRGEIYIGGRGLALGYLNDPVLTADRFVSDPFSADRNARLYRTGDIGAYLPDGQIAFHGRTDEQVKINGFRVELNEVASVLGRHPAVRETVISARENEAGEKQLVAYIVPSSTLPNVTELRDFLSAEVPEYMLPAMFVRMESLPVAASGKLDRQALPVPNEQNILRDEVFQQPNSATEERVGTIVVSLLGVERVGVNDNFFYLGGNSLFGTQLIARLRDAFQVEVPLLKLFDHPTVAELSLEIERMMFARIENMSEEEAQRLLAMNTAQSTL